MLIEGAAALGSAIANCAHDVSSDALVDVRQRIVGPARARKTPGGPEIALSGTQAGNHIMVKPLSLGGPRVTHWKNSPSDAGPIGAMAVGALAAEEGFIRAKIMLGTPNGGCAVIPEGILTTSPHHS
jgi:hypothetical protein